MKPENHAIRQLEKQLDTATASEAVAIKRVVLALTACVMNRKEPSAYAQAKKQLGIELATLEKLQAGKER